MQRTDRGFILATTLLVMTMLTVMLTAAFVMVSAEYRSTNGSYATTRALNFAQAGLQQYFSVAHTFVGGSSYDSVNYTYSGGYARVVARKLRDSIVGSERAVWIVYSTGLDTTRTLTAQGSASRVVAQLANFSTGSLPAPAAMLAPNGVNMIGTGSNPINGINTGFDVAAYSCVTPNPPSAAYDTIGLYTPAGETEAYDAGGEIVIYDNGTAESGNNNRLTDVNKSWTTDEYVDYWLTIVSGAGAGQTRAIASNTATELRVSPNWTVNPAAGSVYRIQSAVRYMSTPTEVIDTTRIDWQALVSGEFTPDYYGTLPASGNTLYQSHYFTGDVTIPSGTRRGLLVAQGDVTIDANAHWDGIIIAGGLLDADVNGAYYIHGMVITGLNIALGANVFRNRVRRAPAGIYPNTTTTRFIQWDYCYAKASIASLSFLVPITGTFTDSWKTY